MGQRRQKCGQNIDNEKNTNISNIFALKPLDIIAWTPNYMYPLLNMRKVTLGYFKRSLKGQKFFFFCNLVFLTLESSLLTKNKHILFLAIFFYDLYFLRYYELKYVKINFSFWNLHISTPNMLGNKGRRKKLLKTRYVYFLIIKKILWSKKHDCKKKNFWLFMTPFMTFSNVQRCSWKIYIM